jgi:type IV pilus assembly protein PilM
MRPPLRSSSWLTPPAPTVAVEIANRRVTVVELGRSGGGAVVTGFATEPIPADAVLPALTGVNIANVEVVADALRRALDRAGLRSARRAALIVPDGVARVSLLPFEQLPARQSDLDQLVRWQVRKAMPFPIEEAHVSHFVANNEGGTTLAAVVARREVIAQYESVTAAAGIHAGIVDLASLNVMNAVMAAGAAAAGDWLVVCLAAEGTTLAILRGQSLMFYRHRAAVDEEPLSALVHQTAMYHEDRLGGSKFARVWLSGAGVMTAGVEDLRRDISERLGLSADTVDVRPAADVRDRAGTTVDVLDALAAPVGVLLRDRKAA